ncbi:MAG: nuclear transport factor 2 family protein [Deltaproteobacteria bacterium]
MKSVYRIALIVFLVLLLGACQKQQQPFTEVEKETVKKEVKEQFNQLAAAINQKNADAWSRFYSTDEFVSAIAGTDYYAGRSAWVDAITKYFSMRERQHIEPLDVRIAALAPNLALMTSEEKSEMLFKDGKNIKSKHVYTMIWKKERDVWKILHSHESWIEEPVK